MAETGQFKLIVDLISLTAEAALLVDLGTGADTVETTGGMGGTGKALVELFIAVLT